jgi:aldehyde:ferredoxin oxidoreductase
MPTTHAGTLLRVDLSTGQCQTEPIDDALVRHVLLGSGLAAHLFYHEMDPTLDPLAPESPLYAFNGLLTGTLAPTACRSSWCGRSPLTGIWNEANVGGHWGAELRFAGVDGMVITGRAAEPVVLWVHDGEAEIRPADHLWGLDQYDTFDRVVEETDPKAQVASIGPAGENQVPLASLLQGGREGSRAAGRGGMGALMGSKHLKAIAVRGKDRPTYPDPSAFRALVKELNTYIQAGSASMMQLGTSGGVPATEKVGDLALKNWRLGNWDRAYEVSGQKIAETVFERHTRCFACPIGCGKTLKITEGPYAGVSGHRPEYETLAGFGGNCLCDDLHAVARMNDLCNRYGLDTISTSGALAFAMEAFEKGILTPEDTGGLDLTWGNAEAMIEVIHRIARQEGLGRLLGLGVRAAAEELGDEAATFALQVKGLELPYHDPRAFVSMAVGYATANRGACHLESLSYWMGYGTGFEGWHDPDESFDPHDSAGKAQVVFDFQNYMSVYNPLGVCKFIAKANFGPDRMAALVNAATGWEWTVDDVLSIGERSFTLKRLINNRLGVTRADDTLPARLLTEPRPTGGAAGVLPDLDRMLPEYYALRGWGQDGMPTPERLAALGLTA